MKSLFILISLFSMNADAYQCEYKSNEEILKESKSVFVGDVIANDGKSAKFVIEKSYVGNLSGEITVKYEKGIADHNGNIKQFKVGEKLVISSSYLVSNGWLLLDTCGISYYPKSSPDLMKLIEKKFPGKNN